MEIRTGASTPRLLEPGHDPRTSAVEWILRLGVCTCFVGHGVFGLQQKPAWLTYFSTLGIVDEAALGLMPAVGIVDVIVGLASLIRPALMVLSWASFWGFATASLRPFAGEPVWETLERAGNYGVPFALLIALVSAPGEWRPRVSRILHATTVLLLLGHGFLALSGKPLLVSHVEAIGLPQMATTAMGAIEVVMALAVWVRPSSGMLYFVTGWKLLTELAFPLSGAPIWEFVERGGSYAAPLALAILIRGHRAERIAIRLAPAMRIHAAVLLLAVVSPVGLASQTGQDGSTITRRTPDAVALEAIVDQLRGGGLTLLCRHAATDNAPDSGPARAQQRNLNQAGRRQARDMGQAIRGAGIEIGEVLSSPMFRTMDTAELAFGRAEPEPLLLRETVTSGDKTSFRALERRLAQTPENGNRVLMTHQGVVRALVDIGSSPFEEGDCLVLRTLGEDRPYEVLARVGAVDWQRGRE